MFLSSSHITLSFIVFGLSIIGKATQSVTYNKIFAIYFAFPGLKGSVKLRKNLFLKSEL